MSKINLYDIDMLRNVNEVRVWDLAQRFFQEHSEYCTCRECILDTVAITLNNIAPHYQISEDDYSEAENKVTDEEILDAMKRAADKVKKHPHHF